MSVNVGEAVGYLDLDTSKFKSGFRSAMTDLRQFKVDSESTMDSLKQTSGATFMSVGSNLTNLITKPALVAGTALAGIAIGKGWSRMSQLDTAKAKLEALGNSTKDVQLITENVGKVVEGTAYTSAQAMTVAASAVAAGIKPGQELERYLGLIGDAAAVAGTDMNEMGAIFNKVTTTGKASAETMNQLAERGIPVWSLLAKATGKSMDDLRAAVSSGQVSIEDLERAIELGMGGAARVIGSKTITGALENLWAYIGLLGQKFLGASDDASSFAGQLLPVLNDLIQKVQDLTPKAEALGKAFGKSFTSIVNTFKDIPNSVKLFTAGIAVTSGPILSLVGKTINARNALNSFSVASNGASAASGVLSGQLKISQALLGGFGNKVSSAFTAVKAGFSNLSVETAKNTAANTLNAISQSKIATGARNAATSVLAFASANKAAILATLGIAGPILLLIGYMAKTGTSAEEMANIITVATKVAVNRIQSFAEELPGIVENLVSSLTVIIKSITSEIPQLIPVIIDAGIQLFGALLIGLTQIIGPITAALPTIVKSIVSGITTLVPAIVQAGITLFTALVKAIPQVVPVLISALPQIISAIVSGLLALGSALITVGIDLFKSLWSGMKTYGPVVVKNVLSWAKSLPKTIKSGLGNLVQIGKDWLQGLWNGLKSKFDSVISWASKQVAKLPAAFKKILGIGSPSRISRSYGMFWMEGLRLGIVDLTSRLISSAKSQVQQIMKVYSGAQMGLDGSMDMSLATSVTGATVGKSQQFDYDKFSQIVEAGNETLAAVIHEAVTDAMKNLTIKYDSREVGRVVRSFV